MRIRLYRPGRLSFVLPLLFLATLAPSLMRYLGGVHPAYASGTHHTSRSRMVHPRYWYGGRVQVRQAMNLACQAPGAAARCLTPQQIQAAYNVQPLLAQGVNGVGHTIVIVDAYQSPTLPGDLHLFDQAFGLPDPTLRVFTPDGLAPFDPANQDQVGWSAEISLDVEWAHAIAPGAAIDLVLSNPPAMPNGNTPSGMVLALLRATAFAVNNNLGDVITQSFGISEACAGPAALQAEHAVFQAATNEGITLLAASGDTGAAEPDCAGTLARGILTPASDPLVTAVGGTTLSTTGGESYLGETAWLGSGGGFSASYPLPDFQRGVVNSVQRGVPDVAYDADPASGVLVVWSSSGMGQNTVFVFGGTSAGTPQWAAIVSLLNQVAGRRLGFLNGILYQLRGIQGTGTSQPLHDITLGNNTFTGKNTNGVQVSVTGFDAVAGWDPATGLGSPDVLLLAQRIPMA